MRLSSTTGSRALFLLLSLLCCARAVGPRPIGSPPRRASRRKRTDDLAASQNSIASTTSPDFTVSAIPTSLNVTIQLGTNDSYGEADGTLILAGTDGFAENVNLACTVTPSVADEPMCGVFPSPIPVDSSGVNSMATLEVQTYTPVCNSTPVSRVPPGFNNYREWRAVIGGGVLLVALLCCSTTLVSRDGRGGVLRAAFLCAVGLAMSGCGATQSNLSVCEIGNFDPGTPPGIYMLTITATSGDLSHTVTVPVTVPARL